MANIIVNVRPHPKYEDGDILDVRQDRQILRCQAEMICHRKNAPRNEQGCMRRGELAEVFYDRTHQYRFERIGNEVRRVNLWTGQVDVFGNDPREIDGKMQHIDVDLFVRKALKHQGHKIFGDVDNAVWYGGQIRDHQLDSLWNEIETRTPHRKANFRDFPYSEIERKRYLAIPVEDFDDKEYERMTEPLYEVDEDTGEFILDEGGQRIVEKARREKYDWRALLSEAGVSEAEVHNENLTVDLRSIIPARKVKDHREKKPNRRERRGPPGR